MSQGEFVAELETGSLQRRDPDGPMAYRRRCDGCETLLWCGRALVLGVVERCATRLGFVS